MTDTKPGEAPPDAASEGKPQADKARSDEERPTCRACKGTGRFGTEPGDGCTSCHGTGHECKVCLKAEAPPPEPREEYIPRCTCPAGDCPWHSAKTYVSDLYQESLDPPEAPPPEPSVHNHKWAERAEGVWVCACGHTFDMGAPEPSAASVETLRKEMEAAKVRHANRLYTPEMLRADLKGAGTSLDARALVERMRGEFCIHDQAEYPDSKYPETKDECHRGCMEALIQQHTAALTQEWEKNTRMLLDIERESALARYTTKVAAMDAELEEERTRAKARLPIHEYVTWTGPGCGYTGDACGRTDPGPHKGE